MFNLVAIHILIFLLCNSLLKENEDVVKAALKATGGRFILEDCLPSWTHRGLAVFQGGSLKRVQFRQLPNLNPEV